VAPGDSVYNSQLVTQVINKVMLDGKKSVAELIVYEALKTVEAKTGRLAANWLRSGIGATAMSPVASASECMSR
jgi:small subunit ribosomal protein S7